MTSLNDIDILYCTIDVEINGFDVIGDIVVIVHFDGIVVEVAGCVGLDVSQPRDVDGHAFVRLKTSFAVIVDLVPKGGIGDRGHGHRQAMRRV